MSLSEVLPLTVPVLNCSRLQFGMLQAKAALLTAPPKTCIAAWRSALRFLPVDHKVGPCSAAEPAPLMFLSLVLHGSPALALNCGNTHASCNLSTQSPEARPFLLKTLPVGPNRHDRDPPHKPQTFRRQLLSETPPPHSAVTKLCSCASICLTAAAASGELSWP